MADAIGFAKKRAIEFLIGSAGCQIGVWMAFSLPNGFAWALLQTDGSRLIAGRFDLSIVLPPDAPWALQAAEEFGPVVGVGL